MLNIEQGTVRTTLRDGHCGTSLEAKLFPSCVAILWILGTADLFENREPSSIPISHLATHEAIPWYQMIMRVGLGFVTLMQSSFESWPIKSPVRTFKADLPHAWLT